MKKKRDEVASAKKIFSKYGHDCTLDYLPDRYEYGNIPNAGFYNKLRRWWIRATVVSEPTDDVHVHAKHLQSFGAIVKERRRQVLFYPHRIHPFSRAYTLWACLMLVIIIIELITTPLEYLFHDLRRSAVYDIWWSINFTFICDNILLLNVIVTFFIGYYDEPNQQVVLDFIKIGKNYLKTLFVIDILTVFPPHWECILGKEAGTALILVDIIGLFKYLLVIRFYKFLTLIMVEKYHVNFYYYMTSLVVIFTALFWHIACCMIMFLRHSMGEKDSRLFDEPDDETIVDQPHIHYESSVQAEWTVLSAAYYRGSQIIYNSSCGKHLPASELEIILIWLAWYGSLLFFIYILSLIMVIMTAKTSSSHKYSEMERQLKDYMRYKQLPMSMRQRIMTYYGFRFQNNYFQEHDILATISEQLRQEINLHACRKLVENVIFFRNLPLNLLVRIISCLKIEIYLVNDVIIRANTPGSSMYFISTGTVAIFTKTGKEICHLEDGSHFGEVALIIKNTLRTASVVAVEVSEIYRLDQKDFVKAINPYPDLLANIQRIAAERMEVAAMMDDHNRDN